jgi:hypothetical protein
MLSLFTDLLQIYLMNDFYLSRVLIYEPPNIAQRSVREKIGQLN